MIANATAAVSSNAVVGPKSTSDKSLREQLAGRESQELILAFSGAIGAGIKEVMALFVAELTRVGYKHESIKVSDLIGREATRLLAKVGAEDTFPTLRESTGLARYKSYQEAGNALRKHFDHAVLAKLVVAHIAQYREGILQIEGDKAPPRFVFLIDSLKHQEEAKFLRQIYGNNFYMIGVLAAEQFRSARIEFDTGEKPAPVKEVIDRDRKQDITHGQQLDKALKLSDFFIRNSDSNKKILESQIRRFVNIMHGAVDETPTRDEFGMYVAYSSGLASACMSRQVGAAILDGEGTVLSTGCNDVPKAGGGLYSGGENDSRCVMRTDGICYNDAEKNDIRKEILKILVDGTSNGKVEVKLAEELALKIREDTRLGDLIEFSRAVHAEMDALIAIARKGGGSVKGATLYTTVYPCHNCARHILASGLTRVLFVEPYEKSLALRLHSDAIVHDIEPKDAGSTKIPFLHFEGVAPRRYQELFNFGNGRKDSSGRKVSADLTVAGKKIPQMLDGYRIIEDKVVQSLISQNLLERATPPPTGQPPPAAA